MESPPGRRIVIVGAAFPGDSDAVTALFAEYADSLGFSLDYQGFDGEVAGLPGAYAPPTGALLLARVDGDAVGIVALRGLEPGICEMKRLYVRPVARALRTVDGVSIGRALAMAIVAAARQLGYQRIRLDTVVGVMDAAIRIYQAMGFREIPAYYPSPLPGTTYLELAL